MSNLNTPDLELVSNAYADLATALGFMRCILSDELETVTLEGTGPAVEGRMAEALDKLDRAMIGTRCERFNPKRHPELAAQMSIVT